MIRHAWDMDDPLRQALIPPIAGAVQSGAFVPATRPLLARGTVGESGAGDRSRRRIAVRSCSVVNSRSGTPRSCALRVEHLSIYLDPLSATNRLASVTEPQGDPSASFTTGPRRGTIVHQREKWFSSHALFASFSSFWPSLTRHPPHSAVMFVVRRRAGPYILRSRFYGHPEERPHVRALRNVRIPKKTCSRSRRARGCARDSVRRIHHRCTLVFEAGFDMMCEGLCRAHQAISWAAISWSADDADSWIRGAFLSRVAHGWGSTQRRLSPSASRHPAVKAACAVPRCLGRRLQIPSLVFADMPSDRCSLVVPHGPRRWRDRGTQDPAGQRCCDHKPITDLFPVRHIPSCCGSEGAHSAFGQLSTARPMSDAYAILSMSLVVSALLSSPPIWPRDLTLAKQASLAAIDYAAASARHRCILRCDLLSCSTTTLRIRSVWRICVLEHGRPGVLPPCAMVGHDVAASCQARRPRYSHRSLNGRRSALRAASVVDCSTSRGQCPTRVFNRRTVDPRGRCTRSWGSATDRYGTTPGPLGAIALPVENRPTAPPRRSRPQLSWPIPRRRVLSRPLRGTLLPSSPTARARWWSECRRARTVPSAARVRAWRRGVVHACSPGLFRSPPRASQSCPRLARVSCSTTAVSAERHRCCAILDCARERCCAARDTAFAAREGGPFGDGATAPTSTADNTAGGHLSEGYVTG